ncbi:MAG: hypothetical protein COC08_03260 [Maribacter sp.]|nr:MAG: hypothetical protein COC08_03260 [Maribacter sp.]
MFVLWGAVSKEMAEKGINKLLEQAWDDIKWPVVLDLRKNVLYHSYKAHKKGHRVFLAGKNIFQKGNHNH